MTKKDLNNSFGKAIYYKQETNSTMIDMASFKDAEHGSIIMTGFQSQGRGRGKERNWNSSKGMNLLFSISLSPEKISHPLLRVPLICGLALTEYLREIHSLNAVLKWPNDVLINEKKIAGILCEFRGDRFILGMGINCEQKDYPLDISEKTTSLSLEGVSSCKPEIILEGFLQYLRKRLETPEWKKDALSYLYKINEEVFVCEGTPENEKTIGLQIEGLSDEGFLITRVLSTGKIRLINAGEIRFSRFK